MTTRNTYTARQIRLSIVGLLVAFAWLLFVPTHTNAAYEIEKLPEDTVVGDFVVGPGKVELSVQPGETKTVELLVTNRMGTARTFNLAIEDVTGSQDPNTTVVLLGDDRGPYSLHDYLQISEMSFVLQHAERARVPVTISVPADAEPGGRYGTVLVTTTSAEDGTAVEPGMARTGSVIVSRVGTLFFVTVPGDVRTEGALEDFSTIPDKMFFTDGPIRFQVLFGNTGSIHLNPYGEIRIRNIFGQEVGVVRADPWFALPGSLRFRELAWDRGYLGGYYTAELTLNRGYQDILDTATISFVVIPWKLIAIVFGALFALIFAIRFIARRFEIRVKTK